MYGRHYFNRAALLISVALLEAPNDQGLKALAEELKVAAKDVLKIGDEAKKAAETALTEVKNLGKVTEDTKKDFDTKFGALNELTKGVAGLTARLDEVEQKQTRRAGEGGGDEKPAKSLGELVVESEAFKGMTSSARKSVRVQINRKDITSATSTVGVVTSPSNSLIGALRVPGIITPPEQQLTVRDLIAPGQTNSSSVEYAQETGFTNVARVVSEGAAKPKSDITFELKTANVRTIAHIFKASRNILDDAPALRSYIDARARYGLRLAEEDELLTGDGTGQHILGIIPQATAYAAPFVPALPQAIDTVRLAALQAFLALFPPTGIVLNPMDWARIQLTKDTSGRYIVGNPVDGNAPRLWNLPVVESMSMDADTFLLGNFRMAAQIFDRMDIEILLSTENEDDFIKNMVTIRAEQRLALAVYRPEAFIYGDFGFVT